MAKHNQTVDEDDFAGLERLAHNTLKTMRPLSPEMRRQWEAMKRGRPRKPPETKAVPTMITVEPTLLKQIDSTSRKAGISRSQFFANAARQALKKAG